MQIAGKVRMALTPRINHWWNVMLYITPRSVTTGTIPHGSIAFAVTFDFIDHVLLIETSEGATEKIKLAPLPVAEFYALFMARLRRMRRHSTAAKLRTANAFYDTTLKELLLPHDAMRQATDPDRALVEFFEDTYVAAADNGK